MKLAVIVIGVTMAVKSTVGHVARIGADTRTVRLNLVRNIEAVNVHQPAFDTQVSVHQLVQVHLHFQVSGFNPVD